MATVVLGDAVQLEVPAAAEGEPPDALGESPESLDEPRSPNTASATSTTATSAPTPMMIGSFDPPPDGTGYGPVASGDHCC